MSKKKIGTKKVKDFSTEDTIVHMSMPKISESVSLHIPGVDGQTPSPIDVTENKTPLGWTSTAKGSPVFNIPGLAAPKVRILPGRIVDKDTGLRTTREEQKLCECGTAYTYHNKARHLKSKKHTDFMQQKESFLGLATAGTKV